MWLGYSVPCLHCVALLPGSKVAATTAPVSVMTCTNIQCYVLIHTDLHNLKGWGWHCADNCIGMERGCSSLFCRVDGGSRKLRNVGNKQIVRHRDLGNGSSIPCRGKRLPSTPGPGPLWQPPSVLSSCH
jgi:hypothetical protein